MTQDWTYWPSDPVWLDSGFWDWRPPWVRPARPGTMRWALQRTVEPTAEAASLSLAKRHLKIDFDDDDELIIELIRTSRDYIERSTGYAMLTQTWKLYLDRFPRENAYESWPWTAPPGTILIPITPIQSITSLPWFDVNGGTNTVSSSDYITDFASRLPRLTLAANKSWPSTPALVPQNGVVLTFAAGHTSAGLVPPTLRHAQLLLIGHWYANREDVVIDNRVAAVEVPRAAKDLLGLHNPVMVG